MKLADKHIKRLVFFIGAGIVALVLASFFALTVRQDKMLKNSVHLSAERLFENIVLTRRWNTNYGGIFVLKKEGISSNPYLEHPDIVSASGLVYTLKNPALMTREISELAKEAGNFAYHITSLKLMNPGNEPDAWERETLNSFETGVKERTQIANVHGTLVYRYMRPLSVEDGCLKCHAKQGYKGGEVRGGISVSLPYQEIALELRNNHLRMILLALTITGIFCFLFYFVIGRLVGNLVTTRRELRGQKHLLEELNSDLDQKVLDRTIELQESEKRFRNTFEQAPVGISHIALNGYFLRTNHKFCEIVGYSEEQLLARTFQDITATQNLDSAHWEWESLLRGEKENFFVEKRYLQRNREEIVVQLTISLVRKASGAPSYYIVVMEDISRRHHLEQQLQQAQKMEAIGTLAGGVAHDFNNILTPIIGYTEIMLMKSGNDDSQSRYLHEIFNAACRAKELIKQILAFSRLRDYEKRPLNMAVIAKEVLKLLRASIPSSIEIRKNIDQRRCIVFADPTQLHQLLMNLCTNAYQAMRHTNGVLQVRLAVQQEHTSKELQNKGMGGSVILEVSDTGCGMDPTILDRMYEPYFTTKEMGEGTGLGLAMVHGIVENLKGKITVQSQPEKGTTFTVTLPLADGDHVNQVLIAGRSEVQGGTEKILLVDDDPMVAATQQAMLSELGYQVTAQNNSSQALDLFANAPDAFDLVITDMTMPTMPGLVMANKMVSIRNDIPIILCTGYSTELSEQAKKAGNILAVLPKPLFHDILARTVRHALDGKLVPIKR